MSKFDIIYFESVSGDMVVTDQSENLSLPLLLPYQPYEVLCWTYACLIDPSCLGWKRPASTTYPRLLPVYTLRLPSHGFDSRFFRSQWPSILRVISIVFPLLLQRANSPMGSLWLRVIYLNLPNIFGSNVIAFAILLKAAMCNKGWSSICLRIT